MFFNLIILSTSTLLLNTTRFWREDYPKGEAVELPDQNLFYTFAHSQIAITGRFNLQMEKKSHENKTFEHINYVEKAVTHREFEACTFIKCDLSNSNFSYTNFIDCNFLDCNLSLQKLNGAGLRNTYFERCKLMGVSFYEANDFLFSVGFRDCLLDYASFSNKKMIKTQFVDCSLKEVSFANANLSKSIFDNCNLERAIFNNTLLKEADFLTAYNYTLDPETNKIEKARFSLAGSVGLLAKYKIRIE